MIRSVCTFATVALLAVACGAGSPAATVGPTPTSATTPAPSPTLTVSPAESASAPVPSIDPALPPPDAVDAAGLCTEGSPLCTLIDVATWRSIPFTPKVACSALGRQCQVVANIYGPTHRGDWPLFVVVSGADEYETPDAADSAYIDDFAKQLAGRGAVVMRANWRRGPGQALGSPHRSPISPARSASPA